MGYWGGYDFGVFPFPIKISRIYTYLFARNRIMVIGMRNILLTVLVTILSGCVTPGFVPDSGHKNVPDIQVGESMSSVETDMRNYGYTFIAVRGHSDKVISYVYRREFGQVDALIRVDEKDGIVTGVEALVN